MLSFSPRPPLLLILLCLVALESCADLPLPACALFRASCARLALRLRGGSSAVWAAIEDADSESDRERLEGNGDGGGPLRSFNMEELLREYEGKTTWEKLTKFVEGLQVNLDYLYLSSSRQ
jgi:hypothetical protein